ncbi:MAG: hypothetical protein WDM80_05325 [Limisphaerales bacterium]
MNQLIAPSKNLTEQQEIVRRVAGLFALADQLELRLAQARGRVVKFMPSLSAAALLWCDKPRPCLRRQIRFPKSRRRLDGKLQ